MLDAALFPLNLSPMRTPLCLVLLVVAAILTGCQTVEYAVK